MLTQVVLLSALLALVAADVEYRALPPIPEKFKGQRGCYIAEEHFLVPFNSATVIVGRCFQYTCSPKNITVMSCSGPTDPSCKIVKQDTITFYPYCCPMYLCS